MLHVQLLKRSYLSISIFVERLQQKCIFSSGENPVYAATAVAVAEDETITKANVLISAVVLQQQHRCRVVKLTWSHLSIIRRK